MKEFDETGGDMTEPSNPPKNRIPQTQEVTLMLTLKIPARLDTSIWPGHIVLEDIQATFT